MKKFMKVCAVLALVMVALGIVISAVGGRIAGARTISEVVDAVTGGKVRVDMGVLTDWGVIIGEQIADNFQEIDYDINDSTMFDESYDVRKGDVEKYCPGDGISNLDIEVGGCSFETKSSGDESFYLEVQDAYKFQGYVEGNTLYIKATTGSAHWTEIGSCEITLYLPDNFRFDTVDIELGAGILEFGELYAGEASLEVGAGEITISGARAEDLELIVGAGRIELADMAVARLNMEVGMGECLADGSVSESADVECAMGNVEIKLDGSEEDFNYRLEGAMGNIDLGSDSFSGLAQERTIAYGADKDMKVVCAMGNISISFTD